jgi:hypothetical protein
MESSPLYYMESSPYTCEEHTIQYIKLGTTGMDVSPIAIGAMTYGEPKRGHPVWSKGEEEARPLIKHALDAGINFFDTAHDRLSPARHARSRCTALPSQGSLLER